MSETNEKNYFLILNKIICDVEKKNKMNYVSWSDAWAEVKKIHPDANYTIYENTDWFPFWESKFGIDVKVWVTINWIEHIVRLPVMDWANNSMTDKEQKYTILKNVYEYWKPVYENNRIKKEEVQVTIAAATTFDINKTIQRAFAKAIAMHGLWLYVFRWEDFPEEIWEHSVSEEKKEVKKEENKAYTPKTSESSNKKKYFNFPDMQACIDAWCVTWEDFRKVIEQDWYTVSKYPAKAIEEYLKTWNVTKDMFFESYWEGL